MSFSALEEPTPPNHGVDIAKAVAIATLSAVAAGFVNWWIEDLKETRRELRELRRTKSETKPEDKPS